MVLLFSSDYYPVYKKDIFAVSSLPESYCYHFRYQSKYVSQKIKDGLNLEYCLAVIIFVHGNTKTNPNPNFSYVPVRLARIVKVHQDPQTSLYHVYFTLGAFVEIADDIRTFDEIPPDTFFGIQVVQPKYTRVLWKDVIKKLNPYGNALFFHIKILKNLKEVLPTYHHDTYESAFEIKEGQNYSLQISIADDNPQKDENEIVAKIEGTDIKSNIGDTINSGLSLDDRSFRLSGLIIGDLSSRVNLIKISTKAQDPNKVINDYSVRLLFDVEKDSARRRNYFWLSIFVLLGGGLVTMDLSKIGITNGPAIITKLIGLVVAALAAANLFYRFNKK